MTGEVRTELVTLTAEQHAVVAALLAGATHTEAAEQVGVARETVSRWVHHHPGVRAELARAQSEAVDAIRGSVLDLVQSALARVAQLVDDGDDRMLLYVLDRLPPQAFTAALERPPHVTAEAIAAADAFDPHQWLDQWVRGEV